MGLLNFKRNFQNTCDSLWRGYTLEETRETFGNYEVNGFLNYIQENNLTIEEALSIYQYSINSNMMLGLARGTSTKESIKEGLFEKMKESFSKTIVSSQVENIYQESRKFAEGLDYSKNEYELSNQAITFAKENKLPISPLTTAIEDVVHLHKAKDAMNIVSKVLSRNELQKDTILYRGVNSSYLVKEGEKFDADKLVGQVVTNKEATSTTYDKNAGFVQSKNTDLIFEIHAPKGTKGLDIEPLSGFRKEKEILLEGHQLIINKIRYDGEKAIAICDLKPLEKEQRIEQTNNKEESVDDIYLENVPMDNSGISNSIFRQKENNNFDLDNIDLL